MTDGLVLRAGPPRPVPEHDAPRRDALRALAARFAQGAAAHDREGSFPHENFADLRQAGLTGLAVPRAMGGRGAGLAEVAEAVGILAEGCPATALVLAMQAIQTRAVTQGPGWSERVRSLVGHGAVERGELVNALRVEPELGTPARGGLPATVARRTATGWSLTGRKIYSTGAPGLSWGLVFARTEEDAPRVGMFLVPLRAPGVSLVETWDQAGLRASGSHDVLFQDVAVPADQAGELAPPAGGRPDIGQVAWNTLLVAALYTGVARAARDWLVGFLRERVPANLGAPLATLPRMQEAAGRIEGLIRTNERLVRSAAREGDADTNELGLIKTVAAGNAIEAVQQAVALCGNHALSRGNPLERHLRDVLCARIHTPQPDAALTAAGRAVLGS